MQRDEVRWYTFALPAVITTLHDDRWNEVRRALLVGCGFGAQS